MTIAKAITAALIAALGALAAAAGDGISVQEGLTAAVAGLVALGGVWAVPNRTLPPPNSADRQ